MVSAERKIEDITMNEKEIARELVSLAKSIMASGQGADRERQGRRWVYKLNIGKILEPYMDEDIVTSDMAKKAAGEVEKAIRKAIRDPRLERALAEDFEAAISELESSADDFSTADDVDEIDYYLNDLYDWGDLYSVWLGQ